MNVLQVGEIGSTNLGDGVIAQCLSYGIRTCGVKVNSLTLADLTKREGASLTEKSSGRSSILKKIHRKLFYKIKFYKLIYTFLRGLRIYFNHRKHFSRVVDGNDLIVVGGGQLLLDNGLDFPFKILALAFAAREHNVPITFYSVGVGVEWSFIGRSIICKAMEWGNVGLLSVRDENSKRNFEANINYAVEIEVVPDVAWIARDAYSHANKTLSASGMGVGVISPLVVKRHAPNNYLADPSSLSFWVALCKEMVRTCGKVSIFTNGDVLDFEFAEQIYGECIVECGENISLIERPTSSSELVTQIRCFDKVVAARLHANIIALAFGIPSVGLVWDSKVASLYQEIGLARNAVGIDERASIASLVSASQSDSSASVGYAEKVPKTIAKALRFSCKK